jgi:two-component system response regulator YcbB
MKIFILDDDQNIIRILEQIITEKCIGNIVGTSNNSLSSINEIKVLDPDIVIMDLLMPELDGISFIEHIREFNSTIKFIMVSQVTSKDMISKAYEKGVTFYINKPINAIEVINVLAEVINYSEKDKRLDMIKTIIGYEHTASAAAETVKYKIDKVLKGIGIISLATTDEIVEVVDYMLKHYEEVKEYSVKEICGKFYDHPKTLEQKIRRTAMIGLENLAYLGLEDNMNETFLEFSNSLYNFKDVKLEMDFIREQSNRRGKVNIRKFLDGLVYYINKD